MRVKNLTPQSCGALRNIQHSLAGSESWGKLRVEKRWSPGLLDRVEAGAVTTDSSRKNIPAMWNIGVLFHKLSCRRKGILAVAIRQQIWLNRSPVQNDRRIDPFPGIFHLYTWQWAAIMNRYICNDEVSTIKHVENQTVGKLGAYDGLTKSIILVKFSTVLTYNDEKITARWKLTMARTNVEECVR